MSELTALETAFETRDSDDDDVRWAISTAAAQWQRGGQADAIVWIRRAAESAEQAGAYARASELRTSAARLAESMWGEPDEVDVEDVLDIDVEVEGAGLAGHNRRPSLPQLEIEEMDLELAVASVSDPDRDGGSAADLMRELQLPDEPASPFGALPPAALSPFEDGGYQDHAPRDISSRATSPAPSHEMSETTVVANNGYANGLDARARAASADMRFPEESPEVLASLGPDTRGPSRVLSSLPPNPRVPRLELVPDDDLEIVDEFEEMQDSLDPIVPEFGAPQFPPGQLRLSEPSPASFPSFSDGPTSGGPYSDVGDLIAEASIMPPADEADDDRPTGDWTSSVHPQRLQRPSVPSLTIDGVSLSDTPGFEDLPEAVQFRLAASAVVEALEEGEEVGLFGAAIVTAGAVDVMPAFADEAGAQAQAGAVVFTRGSLDDAMALRVVARAGGARVIVWRPSELEESLADCPWVGDELRFIADRFLAFCGATLGPLGDSLDLSLRETVFSRMEVKALEPGEVLVSRGSTLPGLFIVAGGKALRWLDGHAQGELGAGDFVCAHAMMTGAVAPEDVRAGPGGALVLFAPRAVAHELMVMVPPLLEAMTTA